MNKKYFVRLAKAKQERLRTHDTRAGNGMLVRPARRFAGTMPLLHSL